MHALYRFAVRHKTYLPYGVAVLAIMAPLLLPGYIFALDMVLTPTMPAPTHIAPNYLAQLALHYASLAIPAEAIQKILLAIILLGAGMGAHRLIAYMTRLSDIR